jgi:lipoprotein-releasing system permease protein
MFTGVYDLDRRFVYIPIDRLQKALYPNENGDLASHIQIKLHPGVNPDLALAEIRGLWQVFAQEQLGWDPYLIGRTEIATAQQMQSRFIAELKKQMGVLLLIFGVVSFSVVVLVFCIFYMIVRLKQKDIAIVKSCGSASSSVAWIFLGFGVCVGIVGSISGAALGYLITKNINTIEGWVRILFGLKLWKSSVYMFSKMPNQVDWASALPIILLAIVAAALGTAIPAIVAARTKPIDILRYE